MCACSSVLVSLQQWRDLLFLACLIPPPSPPASYCVLVIVILKSNSVKFLPRSSIFADFTGRASFFLCPFQPFNLPPALPLILFLCPPSLSLLLRSLSSLCGRTWYSLACLSSRRLDSSNLLQEPRVLARIIHCTKPDRAALKPPLFSAAFFFPPLQICYFSKVRPRPPFRCPPVSLTGVDAQRILRQPPQSAG